MKDYQKLVNRSDGFVFLRDKESGKLLAVDSTAYEHPSARPFSSLERVMVDSLMIDTRVWITHNAGRTRDFFFAENAEDIVELFQNFGGWARVDLGVDHEYLVDLQLAKKVLTMPTTPPGQGKSLSRFDEEG